MDGFERKGQCRDICTNPAAKESVITPQPNVHLWCLYDLRTQRLHKCLLFDEARAVICSVELKFWEHWLAWRDDWLEWKPVNEVAGLCERIQRQLMVMPPTPPGADPDFLNDDVSSGDGAPAGMILDDEALDDELSLSVSKIRDPDEFTPTPEKDESDFIIRAKKRYKKRYGITIEIDGKIFKTNSIDISVGGVYVEDPLPDWVQGLFKVRIRKPNSKQQIELQCAMVENQPPHARQRFKILPLQNPVDEANLEAWLAA